MLAASSFARITTLRRVGFDTIRRSGGLAREPPHATRRAWYSLGDDHAARHRYRRTPGRARPPPAALHRHSAGHLGDLPQRAERAAPTWGGCGLRRVHAAAWLPRPRAQRAARETGASRAPGRARDQQRLRGGALVPAAGAGPRHRDALHRMRCPHARAVAVGPRARTYPGRAALRAVSDLGGRPLDVRGLGDRSVQWRGTATGGSAPPRPCAARHHAVPLHTARRAPEARDPGAGGDRMAVGLDADERGSVERARRDDA